MSSSSLPRWVEYDYAVIRLVPLVHSGAFVNVGIVLHARGEGYLEARFNLAPERIAPLAHGFNLELLRTYADAFEKVCAGGPAGGPIGLLPPSERFHWLTAPRSTALQTSPVHPGRCVNLPEALRRLMLEHCDGGIV